MWRSCRRSSAMRRPGFTRSVYQHVREGMAEQAADAIERAFGQ